APDEALGAENGPRGIDDRLALGDRPDQSLPLRREGEDRGGQPLARPRWNDHGVAIDDRGDHGIRRAEVDPYGRLMGHAVLDPLPVRTLGTGFCASRRPGRTPSRLVAPPSMRPLLTLRAGGEARCPPRPPPPRPRGRHSRCASFPPIVPPPPPAAPPAPSGN